MTFIYFRGRHTSRERSHNSLISRPSSPRAVPSRGLSRNRACDFHRTRLKPALKYLSRGVNTEKNILSCREGEVIFRYTESATGKICYRTLKGEDFLWLVLQHVLPRGFRRVRDYGFLHGNAKRVLKLVQLILHVMLETKPPSEAVRE